MKKFIYAFAALGVVIIDQVTKYYALVLCDHRCTINQYLSFDISFNRGISWGMLHSSNDTVFALVTMVITLCTLFLARFALWRYKKGMLILGEVLVVAGSFSNLIDRAWYHGVVDFIELSYRDWVWPLFNMADCAIVLGVVIMVWEYGNE